MTIWEELKAPFADEDIEWRVSRCGKKDGKPWAVLVPYLTARAIMNRLDAVAGVDGWSDEYRAITNGSEHGLICHLTVKDVSKEDGAGFSDVESIKGGFSDALKRAAVKFGMGRFLYEIDEVFVSGADIHDGYPQKGSASVAIFSKQENIRGWCAAPRVSELMGKKPDPAKPAAQSIPTQAEPGRGAAIASLSGRISALNRALDGDKLIDDFHRDLSQAKGAEAQGKVIAQWEHDMAEKKGAA